LGWVSLQVEKYEAMDFSLLNFFFLFNLKFLKSNFLKINWVVFATKKNGEIIIL
jgi:hypothetical protein